MKVEIQAPEQKKKMHRTQAVCIVLVICHIVAAVTAVIKYYVSEYYITNAELHSLQDKVRTSAPPPTPPTTAAGFDHKVLNNHAPGPCRRLKGAEFGSDDLTIMANGRAFIPSGLHQHGDFPGGILTIDLASSSHNDIVKTMPIYGFNDMTKFNPHGISVWTDPVSGNITLKVVSHPVGHTNAIESFWFNPGMESLHYLGGIKMDLFDEFWLNDLVVIDEETFYTTGFNREEEVENDEKTGSVIYYDGSTARLLLDGLGLANGIDLSPDKRHLYVSEYQTGDVSVYERNEETNELRKLQTINLDTAVNAIHVDEETGELWMAASPSYWKTSAFYFDLGRNVIAPGQVLSCQVAPDGTIRYVTCKERYIDPGTEISATTAAGYFRDQLLIGSLGDHMLLCETRPPYKDLDFFPHHSPGPCNEITGAEGGSGDFFVLPDGRTFVSSGFWSVNIGRLLFYDFNANVNTAAEIPIIGYPHPASEFHPHGLTVWEDPTTGALTVYTITHPSSGDRIEVFDYTDNPTKQLTYVKSISDPIIEQYYTNNLVMVGKDQFYLIAMSVHRLWGYMVEEKKTGTTTGGILFYDGTTLSWLENTKHTIGLGNGINMSPDGRYIYAADYGQMKLHIYLRDRNDNSLTHIQELMVDTNVDGISVDVNGDMWIASHPSHETSTRFDLVGLRYAPTQILRVKVLDGRIQQVDGIYMDDGAEIGGATSAAFYNNKMLVGTLGGGFYVCDVLCHY